MTGHVCLSACAAEAVSVSLLCACKGILGHGVYFSQLMERNSSGVCLLFHLTVLHIFIIFPLCPCVCSFRCGVISWLFSPLSTAAPPTWWWPCGSLCPSGKMRSKNGAILQVLLGVTETQWSPFIFVAVWCCLQQYCVVVCWLNSLLSGSCGRSEESGSFVQHYLLQITNPGFPCQVHISRCVIFNLNSFDQILLIKYEIAKNKQQRCQWGNTTFCVNTAVIQEYLSL